jgi:hypothetical protein
VEVPLKIAYRKNLDFCLEYMIKFLQKTFHLLLNNLNQNQLFGLML